MLGSADIESILTEPTLDVWKLYAGPVNVPNWFTWFCTGNYLDLSDDLATRAVEIKLRKPKYDAESKLAAWDLQRVVGGIAAFFARQPADLRVATRFTDWSREVIGRIGTQDLTSGILIQEILARSEEVAVGSDDADELIELLEMFVGCGTAERKVIADQDWWIVPISVFVKFLGYHNVKNANGRDWTNRGLGREMQARAASRHGTVPDEACKRMVVPEFRRGELAPLLRSPPRSPLRSPFGRLPVTGGCRIARGERVTEARSLFVFGHPFGHPVGAVIYGVFFFW